MTPDSELADAGQAPGLPGGTAPTMSAAASAIDKYVLETVDGIHWYGTFWQVLS
jgi:hypothetical protein